MEDVSPVLYVTGMSGENNEQNFDKCLQRRRVQLVCVNITGSTTECAVSGAHRKEL
jgi:fructose-1-phosphate kinase PfkB-like protein